MLTARPTLRVAALLALVAVPGVACSDPNGYPGGGRLLTLPGDSGGAALIQAQADASVSAPDAGATAAPSTDASPASAGD